MQNNTKRCFVLNIIFMCFMAVITSILMLNTISYAKTNNKNAKKAFCEWMAQEMIPWGNGDNYYQKDSYSFRYMEIGKKKTPILIVKSTETSHADGYISVMQYIDGEVKCMMTNDWIEAIYNKSGIIITCHSGGSYGEIESYYYKLNGKGSFVKENAYAKNANGEKAKKCGKLYKNTQKNRNKYLGKWNTDTSSNSLKKDCIKQISGTWFSSSMDNGRPVQKVSFSEKYVKYYSYSSKKGKYVFEYKNKVISIEQLWGDYFIYVKGKNGKYCYKTYSEDGICVCLEYYDTWDGTKFDDYYSVSNSLNR